MKVSELSEKADVPLPTIKFYIREGLLPRGESTSKNQAEYGNAHLQRLALIRALRDEANLGIDAIGRVLRAADGTKNEFIMAAIDAVQPRSTSEPATEEFSSVKEAVLAIASARGWDVSAEDKSVDEAARALVVVSHAFPEEVGSSLDPYFDAADKIAAYEIPEDWAPDESREAALRYALLGTLLFEPFILAVRRMAHLAHTRAAQKKRKGAKKPRTRK